MVDAKDIDILAMALRKQRERLQVQEVAHRLATQFFQAAGDDATEDFRWRVIATMVGEVALREAGLPNSNNTREGSQLRRRRWWL
jgi:hypothetical protein